jgi:hypothetical protein
MLFEFSISDVLLCLSVPGVCVPLLEIPAQQPSSPLRQLEAAQAMSPQGHPKPSKAAGLHWPDQVGPQGQSQPIPWSRMGHLTT